MKKSNLLRWNVLFFFFVGEGSGESGSKMSILVFTFTCGDQISPKKSWGGSGGAVVI